MSEALKFPPQPIPGFSSAGIPWNSLKYSLKLLRDAAQSNLGCVSSDGVQSGLFKICSSQFSSGPMIVLVLERVLGGR